MKQCTWPSGGHNFVKGKCTRCGQPEPKGGDSFDEVMCNVALIMCDLVQPKISTDHVGMVELLQDLEKCKVALKRGLADAPNSNDELCDQIDKVADRLVKYSIAYDIFGGR